MKNKSVSDWVKIFNDIQKTQAENKYLEGFFDLPNLSVESKERSESAKRGWEKYRINYKIANIRESVRNSLGLPKISEDEKFKYH